jgi:serine/threonine protein kinase
LQPGSRFGSYRILAAIGAGGMGEVFRARDEKLNRDVAVKVLRRDVASDEDRLQRFLREAQTLAALNHPSIAHVYGLDDVGVEGAGRGHALVMELVEGEDLAEHIARGPIPIDEAIAIARQIAEALEAAHDLGIVHRDLKPANIKVRPDGTVKVLDFGLARIMESALARPHAADGSSGAANATMTSPAMTEAGVILGTATYMSPEQARGKTVDRRADIWAFGVVLFEMLTGQRAFAGETVTDVMAAVVSKPPDWRLLPKSVPSSIEHLLRRCLEKDHRLRLRDIGEARVTLSTLDRAAPATTPSPPVAAEGLRRWVPWMIAVLAITAVAASVVLKKESVPPIRRLELALPSDGSDFMLSPDGKSIVYRSGTHIRVKTLEQPDPRDLAAATRSGSTAVTWSPDSAFVAYDTPDGKLWKVAVAGGPPLLLATIPETGQLLGASWRRDGSIVVAVWRGGLYAVPASGGDPSPIARIDPKVEIDFHNPVALPDGRLLVATHLLPEPGGPPNRYRLELIDGTRRETIFGSGVFPVGSLASGHLLLERWDANAGLWAVPLTAAGPLNMDAGRLIAPAATAVSTGDGALLLYAIENDAQTTAEMVWVDRSGHVVGQIGPAQIRLASPALSPDQRRVAFSAALTDNADIWIRDLESGSQTRVTSETIHEWEPAWFPTGRHLAYMESSSGVGRLSVVFKNAGGGERVEVVAGAHPSIAPDGRFLLYQVDQRGSPRLWFAPLADGKPGEGAPFFKSQEQPVVTGAIVSPSGDLLAYVEPHPGGRPEVYVTRFPSGEGRWQISTGGGRSPLWSRNGELFFVTGPNDGAKQMMAARVEPGPEFKASTPLKLFDFPDDLQVSFRGTAAFDVTHDGKRFLMVRSRGAAAPSTRRWVLVENWRREFPDLGR